MKILVNGCSYTYGEDLADPIHSRWSTCLGSIAGAEIVNISSPGSSNAKIFRTTMDELLSDGSYTHVIVMWSGWDRVELCLADNQYLLYHSKDQEYYPWAMQVTPGLAYDSKREYIRRRQDAFAYFYNQIWTTEKGIMDTIGSKLILQELCKLKNVNCAQTHFNSGEYRIYYRKTLPSRIDTHPILGKWFKYVNEKVVQLDELNSLSFGDDFDCISDVAKRINNIHPSGHPLEEAHSVYAKQLYDKLNEKGFFL